MSLFFEQVVAEERQINILYDLLKRRAHTISHQSLPTYEDHKDFVCKNPYRIWYLVRDSVGYVGSIYLTDQNTIGINIDDGKLINHINLIINKIKSEFEPLPPIRSVRAGCFSVNVPPSNSELLTALENSGHRAAQISFNV